ncbi:MAG: hypothetical protein HZB56_04835 [Deltaproteobacteria bacterium]|nr:hypothetical protein [Deltaproteobacteria bacterium]
MAETTHRWMFHRVGGLDQVALQTAADLRNLEALDQKLWVALSCPTRGLELDARTLELLDLDKDARVRAPEIIAAVKWCDARLKDLGALLAGKEALPLSAIDDTRPEGKALLQAAKRILAVARKPDATEVLPADVADLSGVWEGSDFNGDGIVPPEAAGDDAETRQVIADAVACAGSEPDRSGRPGIDAKRLDAFFAELAAFDEWARRGEAPALLPLGPDTGAVHAAVSALEAKVDDFFTRCRLAAMDPRGVLLNRADAELAALASRDLSASGSDVASFPIARVEAGRALPLGDGVNPAWAGRVAALARALGGKSAITAAEWAELQARLAPHAAWMGEKKGASVEKLGIARVRALLAGGGKAAVEALLARDKAVEAEAGAVAEVERMVRYHRDLHTLLRNFVSFADFYDPRVPAIFQAGTLYLDGRSCDLCIKVEDPAAHAALAGLSRMYLAYCDLRRPGGEAMKIVAAFTQGDSDFLRAGRNGIFYDRKGRDWDATITRIVENPISIRQAFLSPYKKVLRMIEEQVGKFAAAKEKESDAKLASAAAGATDAVTGARVPPPKAEPVDVGRMVGIIAALGVGAGALGAVFGGFVSGFMALQPWWAKVAAVFGAVMVVSGPSMLIAALKLRQRTLGPVLDATGWAVNGRVRVNLPLGTALTGRAVLPRGATRSLEDPFEDKDARARRRMVTLLLLLVAAALAAARYYRSWPFGPS